jgi:hypothetical protein
MTTLKRLLCSAVAVGALAGLSLLASGATATAGSLAKHRRLQQQSPTVYVGYADSFRKGSPSHPSPWKGSAGVIFRGCNYFHPDRCPKTKSGADRYDSGAVRIVNSSQSNMIVTKVNVKIGSCTFRPWPKLNVTLPAGKQLILAQTGGTPPCNTTRGKYNFDTSDTSKSCTTNDEEFPLVNMTINGEPFTFLDDSQVLNTGGVDPGAIRCGAHNETQNWEFISPP